MQSPRIFIVITLLVAGVAISAVGVFNAWIDPFMQYRMPTYQPRFVTGFARYINAGLARNLEYESVLVGSSYAMNFRNSDFDREFGGRTVNLTMPGMYVSEGRKVVTYAASLKRLRHVFFGLDYFAFVESENRYEFPDYLYDGRWTNDGPYLLSFDTLKRSIYIALNRDPKNFNTDSDMPWSWVGKGGVPLGRDRALADYATKKRACSVSPTACFSAGFIFTGTTNRNRLDEMERVAREQIAPLVALLSDTEFEFFLPPYSALRWMLDAEAGGLPAILRFRIYVAQLIAQYPNAHLHDFQALENLVCDLDHYVDVGHYGPNDNRMMVSAMRSGKYLVTPETVSANNAVIEQIVNGRCSGTMLTGVAQSL
jgi:hypothetical protein